jgi:competence transcription factor ComK
MIEYIIQTPHGTKIYQTNGETEISHRSIYIVKQLCEKALFSYEGYIKAVKKIISRKYKIPVVIDQFTKLIPTKNTKSYDNVWLNYEAIQNIKKNKDHLEILFHSGKKIYINISFLTIKGQIDDLIRITNSKVKHFHS